MAETGNSSESQQEGKKSKAKTPRKPKESASSLKQSQSHFRTLLYVN